MSNKSEKKINKKLKKHNYLLVKLPTIRCSHFNGVKNGSERPKYQEKKLTQYKFCYHTENQSMWLNNPFHLKLYFLECYYLAIFGPSVL